jgi:hypothetical protein
VDIKKYDDAKFIAVKRKIDILTKQVVAGEISPAIATGRLERFMHSLDISDGVIIELPRIAEDSFLRKEDLAYLAEALSTNYAVISSELDVAQAVTESVGELVKTRDTALKEACAEAAGAIDTVQAYIAARRKGAGSLNITPEVLTGDFSYWGGAIGAKITGSRKVNFAIESVETNGIESNLLELDESVESGLSLEPSEIIFANNQLEPASSERSLLDKSVATYFEVEQYSIPPFVKDNNYVPMIIEREENGILKPYTWDVDSRTQLYLEMTFSVDGGKLSQFVINPFLEDAARVSVELIEACDDQGRWHIVDRNKILVPDVSTYIGSGYAFKGMGVWQMPMAQATMVRIRLKQDSPYQTIIAHAGYLQRTGANTLTGSAWVSGPAYRIGASRASYFTPAPILFSDGRRIERHIIGIAAHRWTIPIREISGYSNSYAKTSVMTSSDFDLGGMCSATSISATEQIPEGCSILYELSPNQGRDWVELSPVERSSGDNEVLRFSSGGQSNPNRPGVKYLDVDAPVKNLRIRITIKSVDNISPTISSLSINPVMER